MCGFTDITDMYNNYRPGILWVHTIYHMHGHNSVSKQCIYVDKATSVFPSYLAAHAPCSYSNLFLFSLPKIHMHSYAKYSKAAGLQSFL